MKTIKRLALAFILGLTFISCSNDDAVTAPDTTNTTNPSQPSEPTDCRCGYRIVKTDTHPNPDVVIYDHTDVLYLSFVPTWYGQDGAFINMGAIHCGQQDSFSAMGSDYIKVEIFRDCINY